MNPGRQNRCLSVTKIFLLPNPHTSRKFAVTLSIVMRLLVSSTSPYSAVCLSRHTFILSRTASHHAFILSRTASHHAFSVFPRSANHVRIASLCVCILPFFIIRRKITTNLRHMQIICILLVRFLLRVTARSSFFLLFCCYLRCYFCFFTIRGVSSIDAGFYPAFFSLYFRAILSPASSCPLPPARFLSAVHSSGLLPRTFFIFICVYHFFVVILHRKICETNINHKTKDIS